MSYRQANARTPIVFASFALAFLLIFPQLARSATSKWAETMGGAMRIIALPPDSDGVVRAGLEIKPDEGWHTYWRIPGSAGIPPQVDMSASANLELDGIAFPAPDLHAYNDMLDFVYYKPVILPLEIKQQRAGEKSALNANVFIGICQDVCIPFQANFNLTLDPAEPVNLIERAILDVADAALPESTSDDFVVEHVALSDDQRAFTVTMRLPEGATAEDLTVIGSAPHGQVLGAPHIVKNENGSFDISMTPVFLAPSETLKGAGILLLVKSAGRSFETELVLP